MMNRAEHQELLRLRRELAEPRKDKEFRGKAAANFAAKELIKKALR